MTYREQAFTERCYCDAPATLACAACHRPRCDTHIAERGLCHRCHEAVQVELDGGSPRRLAASGATGAATTFAGLLAHVPMTGAIVAVAAAVAVFVTTRPLQRWRAIRQLGPRLAASVGEVKPVVDYDAPRFPAASRNAYTRVP